MGVDLKFTTAGAPDHTYYSLLKFGDNNKLDATLRALSDGQGNDIGIKISTTQVSIDSTLIMGSLTASKLVYLNASKELVTIADGTAGQVLQTNGAGVYTFATVAGGGGITINSTAITSGTAGRILFENASNQVSEAAGLTYASGLFTVLGTTQQAKFAYDASNHLGITIASNGSATYALTGTTPVNIFNQYIGVGTTPTYAFDNLENSNKGTGVHVKNSNTSGAAWAGVSMENSTGVSTIFKLGAGWVTYGIMTANGFGFYNGTSGDIAIANDWGSGNILFAAGGVSEKARISSNGNFGINTGATVTAKLHVISTTIQFKLGYDVSNYASFTTGATGSLTIALTGTAPRTTFSQGVTMGGTLRLTPCTVATLPSGVVGDTAYVTDATAPTYLGALTGGGAVTCPVFYNGSAWVSA